MQIYKHSGAAPALGVLTALAAGLAAAIPLAFIYAYAFWYIPIIYLNVLLTLAFGAIIGGVVAKTAEWGRVRNNVLVVIIALLAGLFGLYVYWGAYFWALVGFAQIGQVGLRAFHPLGLLDLGLHLFEKGSWGLGNNNDQVTGWFLVAIWIAEACVVLGLAVVVSLLNSDRPFCERCQAWTDAERGVARLASTGNEPAWQKVLGGELPALAEFPPSPPGAMQYVRLDLARCPRCTESRFLSIAAVSVSVDKKGKTSETTRSLATNAVITPAQCAVVEACGRLYNEQLEQALAPPDSAEEKGPSAAEEGAT
jgi:hypothetical protein